MKTYKVGDECPGCNEYRCPRELIEAQSEIASLRSRLAEAEKALLEARDVVNKEPRRYPHDMVALMVKILNEALEDR